MDDADEGETKIAPEVLERQQRIERQLNLIEDIPKLKDKYSKVIDSFKASKNYNQHGLFAALRKSVGADIDARTNPGYFNRKFGTPAEKT
ncbi:hypothetical protein ON010_g10688 [Phytophthora cinnamomi]|nr:hypothetical protein ON010_g10688 [Phytophthora cinnamomi]